MLCLHSHFTSYTRGRKQVILVPLKPVFHLQNSLLAQSHSTPLLPQKNLHRQCSISLGTPSCLVFANNDYAKFGGGGGKRGVLCMGFVQVEHYISSIMFSSLIKCFYRQNYLKYSRTPVTRTLKGNEKQFELAEVRVIGVDCLLIF